MVPEMTEEWAAFHTLDIPFVFWLSGAPDTDGHAFVAEMSQYGVDPDDDNRKPLVWTRSCTHNRFDGNDQGRERAQPVRDADLDQFGKVANIS